MADRPPATPSAESSGAHGFRSGLTAAASAPPSPTRRRAEAPRLCGAYCFCCIVCNLLHQSPPDLALCICAYLATAWSACGCTFGHTPVVYYGALMRTSVPPRRPYAHACERIAHSSQPYWTGVQRAHCARTGPHTYMRLCALLSYSHACLCNALPATVQFIHAHMHSRSLPAVFLLQSYWIVLTRPNA